MGKIGAIIFGVLSLIAFLLVLVGTPIDQFRPKSVGVTSKKACLTLWGTKINCYNKKYDKDIGETFLGCKTLVSHFKAAEAFAIISIVVLLAAALLGLISCCCCSCLAYVASVLTFIGVITVVIVWALMANAYNSKVNGCVSTPLKGTYKYGAGFALIVTGWCVLCISIVFLHVL